MKLACSRCGQMTEDGHLWCPQIDCPAGKIPTIFTYGDYVGDIRIIRPLRLFRTAVIYEAEREALTQWDRRRFPTTRDGGVPKVLLKIAHSGSEDSLRTEAKLMATLKDKGIPGLPAWLPPYLPVNPGAPEYGKAVFRGETKYYLVLEYIQGTFLRDMLYENPEPWYRDAAWITIGIAQTISQLQKQGRVIHGNLTPDSVLVTRDEKTRVPRSTLLDLGVMYDGSTLESERIRQIRTHVHPAYAAPEVVADQPSLSNATDVYGLGLLLHEMLAGKPAYDHALRSDQAIVADVKSPRHAPIIPVRRDVPRPDDTHQLIEKAIAKDPTRRYERVSDFRAALINLFGDLPVQPKRDWRDLGRVLFHIAIGAGILLVLGFIMLVLLNILGV